MSEKRLKIDMEEETTNSEADCVKPADEQLQVCRSFPNSSLPEEVLERIFLELSGPRDCLSVSNASPQFRRILKPTIPVWSFEEVFTLIYPGLDKDSILSCRLVCREWNKVVDNFVQTHPITRCLEPYPYNPAKTLAVAIPRAPSNLVPPRYSLQYLPTLLQKDFVGTSFEHALAVSRFIEKVGPSHMASGRNPIILRYLDLANSLWEDHGGPEAFWIQVNNLLSRFGHHLTQVHLGPNTRDDDRQLVLFCYQAVRDSLSKLKNLTILTVSGFDCHTCWQPVDSQIHADLESYIASHPLPELPHLRILETTIPINFKTNPVNQELFKRYAPQLDKVYLTLSVWSPEKNDIFNFKSLVEMQLGVDQDFPKLVNFIEKIHAPQLKKLHLIVHATVKIVPMLESIQKHFPLLEYLKLRFNSKPNAGSNVGPPKFSIGSIKTLEVVDSPVTPYEALLRHLPSLEYFLVTTDRNELESLRTWYGATAIQKWNFRKHLYSGEIYKLNIWEKMKTLKEFTFALMGAGDLMVEIVKKKQYTREMYEYLKANSSKVIVKV